MSANQKPTLPATLPATVEDAFPTPHLRASDLPPGGATVVVHHYKWDHVRPKDKWELKLLLFFTSTSGKPTKKYLILNKTQAQSLAAISGTEAIEAWAGTLVHLSPAEVRGKHTIAIGPPPAPAPPAPEPPAQDEA